MPSIVSRFSFAWSPDAMVTLRFGTPKAFAMTSISSELAAPATGGDWSLTRSAPSRVPAMPGLLARGMTRT